MTIQQLIDKLSTLPPEKKVIIYDKRDDFYYEVVEIAETETEVELITGRY